jgi:hypothetical protein
VLDPDGDGVANVNLWDIPYFKTWLELAQYGFWAMGLNWDLDDLNLILDAIHDFMRFAGLESWDYQGFKNLIELGSGGRIKVTNGVVGPCPSCAGATSGESSTNDLEIVMNVDLIRSRFGAGNSAAFKYIFMHEFGHVWDKLSNYDLSDEMHDERFNTGDPRCSGKNPNRIDECTSALNRADMSGAVDDGPVSPYGRTNRLEDWAEAVASSVYPEYRDTDAQGRPAHGNWTYPGLPTNPRREYVCRQVVACR